jgi:hypothetical protein
MATLHSSGALWFLANLKPFGVSEFHYTSFVALFFIAQTLSPQKFFYIGPEFQWNFGNDIQWVGEKLVSEHPNHSVPIFSHWPGAKLRGELSTAYFLPFVAK